MPKYVVDTDSIRNAAEKLIANAENINQTLTSSNETTKSEIEANSGTAINTISNSNDSAYQKLKNNAETMSNMASYLNEVANIYEEAEDALASQKI